MKRFLCMAVALGVISFASLANAQLALDVTAEGVAWLHNTGGAAVQFDGYQIQDGQEPGRLIPGNLRSVESLINSGDIASVLGTLGAGALGFATAGLSNASIAELTAGAGGVLQPGATWSLGQIFPAGLDGNDGFSFAYNGPGGLANGPINIEVVPEPSTLALCGLGLLGLVAFARRRK